MGAKEMGHTLKTFDTLTVQWCLEYEHSGYLWKCRLFKKTEQINIVFMIVAKDRHKPGLIKAGQTWNIRKKISKNEN